MGTRDPRVDAYIERAEDFAKPILRHLRETVHAASPDIEETMKWSFPHFMYDGIVCSMASFKKHCAFGFWKESLILGNDPERKNEGMGQFGRITSIEDLPPREAIIGYVQEGVRLNEEGVKAPKPATATKREEIEVPEALRTALEENTEAATRFEELPPSHRREYAEWIAEAKREATRDRRIATAIEWIAEGKPRNWKYMKRGS